MNSKHDPRISPAIASGGQLPGPSSSDSEEGQLLILQAKEYIAEPRAESKKRRIRNYTGSRLFKEEPQRYRLITAMLAEGVSLRSIMRACKCDARTIRSIERREAESVSQQKTKVIRTLARIARMTAERILEEIPNMNHAQLAVTCGIAIDKMNTLAGDANLRIEHIVTAPKENIFDRINQLHARLVKIAEAKVVEPIIPALPDDASDGGKEAPQKGES